MDIVGELWDKLGAAGQEAYKTRAKTLMHVYDRTLKVYNAKVTSAAATAAAAAAAAAAKAAAKAAAVTTAGTSTEIAGTAAASAAVTVTTAIATTFPSQDATSSLSVESAFVASEWVTPELSAMYAAAFARMVHTDDPGGWGLAKTASSFESAVDDDAGPKAL